VVDIIYIRGLRVETIIGINDRERTERQTVCLDLEFATENRKAASCDRIEDARDYKAIKKRLVSFIEESRFHLIETLAERISEILISEFAIPWLRLRIGKPGALSGADDVGVIIERRSRDER
jgi:dihydroneopterin aldolase